MIRSSQFGSLNHGVMGNLNTAGTPIVVGPGSKVRFRGEAEVDREARTRKNPLNRSKMTQPRHVPDRLATDECQRSKPRCLGLHCRHRGAAADPGPLIRRALLEIRAVKSSILERNVLRIGDVFAL
jgi:hypothetical protein